MTENEVNMTVEAHKKNLCVMPKVEAASIHVAGNSGKVKDGELKASAFIIMVKCNGEWRPENEWLHKYGFKTARRVYANIEKARAAKEEIKSKWGKSTSAAGKAKEEAVAKAKEALVSQIAEKMRVMGLTEAAISALTGNL